MKDMLPESAKASKDGATKSSMGEAGMADLDKGYTDVKPSGHSEMLPRPTFMDGGFLGRPGGWER